MQANDKEIKALQDRVELNEQRQQQMVAFLAQAMQHPALVQHLMSSQVKRIDDGKRECVCLACFCALVGGCAGVEGLVRDKCDAVTCKELPGKACSILGC